MVENKGVWRYGVRYVVLVMRMEILADFLEDFVIWLRLDFWVGMWMNQLSGLDQITTAFIVFATPVPLVLTVFVYFSVGRAVVRILSRSWLLGVNFISKKIKLKKLLTNHNNLWYYVTVNKIMWLFGKVVLFKLLRKQSEKITKSSWQSLKLVII